MVKGMCFILQNCSLRSLEFHKTPGFSREEQNGRMLTAPFLHHASPGCILSCSQHYGFGRATFD